MPFTFRTPRQSEPGSIAEFLNANHPWMELAIAPSWLWRPAAIVFALMAMRVFSPSHDRQALLVSNPPTAYANAKAAQDLIK